MEILYIDEKIIVCEKPAGILSTDEAGGLPELLRRELGTENVYTVHRLDRVVGGLMVLARSRRAASDLGKELMDGGFGKQYLAVVEGSPAADEAVLRDFMLRDGALRRSFCVPEGSEGAQEAVLNYRVLERRGELTALAVELHTGRTHQIRCQLANAGLPILGDKKYGGRGDGGVALRSVSLSFHHPKSGEAMDFFRLPPRMEPWTEFECFKSEDKCKWKTK